MAFFGMWENLWSHVSIRCENQVVVYCQLQEKESVHKLHESYTLYLPYQGSVRPTWIYHHEKVRQK